MAEFEAYGYHGARMARVARRAGTAHGTVYVYFADKDDLLAAVRAEIDLDLGGALQRMPELEPGPAGFNTVGIWISEVCAAYQRHGALLQALAEALTDEDDSRAGREGLRALSRAVTHSPTVSPPAVRPASTRRRGAVHVCRD